MSDAPRDADPGVRLSVVLPIVGTAEGLDAVVRDYDEALDRLGVPFELILSAAPETAAYCAKAAAHSPSARVEIAEQEAWGCCVRVGLGHASGEVLCYANWERTPPTGLAEMLAYALRNPDLVLRANRRTRDTVRQRAGSLLFNLECRALLGIAAWDVNGTPKIFSRHQRRLMELRRDDDLIDAEFAVVCEREGYPVAEVPIDAVSRGNAVERPNYRAALRMYLGVLGLRRMVSRISSTGLVG